jgi:hypothetical protein
MRRLVVGIKNGHRRLHQEAAQDSLILGAARPKREASAQLGKDNKGEENGLRMLGQLGYFGHVVT